MPARPVFVVPLRNLRNRTSCVSSLKLRLRHSAFKFRFAVKMFTELPVEIWRLIFEFIASWPTENAPLDIRREGNWGKLTTSQLTTATSVLCVCKIWNKIAPEYLFKHFSLNIDKFVMGFMCGDRSVFPEPTSPFNFARYMRIQRSNSDPTKLLQAELLSCMSTVILPKVFFESGGCLLCRLDIRDIIAGTKFLRAVPNMPHLTPCHDNSRSAR